MSFEGLQAIFTVFTFFSTGLEDLQSQKWLRNAGVVLQSHFWIGNAC